MRTPTSPAAFATRSACELGDATVTQFADGESKVRINEDIRGRDIYIVQPTSQPANEHIMELLILVDAIRRASASRITAVVPFFGYARQDRKDRPRVPITAKLVANLLVAAGVNRVLTMDLHAQQIQGFFDIPVDHLYARPVMLRYLKTKQNLDPLVVCSPDVGGLKMAESYAQALGVGLATVAKRRKSDTEVDSDLPHRRRQGHERVPGGRLDQHGRDADQRGAHLQGERRERGLCGRVARRPGRTRLPARGGQ